MPMSQSRPAETVSLRRPRVLLPEGWPRPKGYANGMSAQGRLVVVGGQIGWTPQGDFSDDFIDQVRQALQNILAVLTEGGVGPEDVVRLTWYVLDMDEYLDNLKALGQVYREVMGPNYPAMSLVQVVRLVEPQARVEIEATAVAQD
jgi:enamine deaminase RidA (YjgF/YER057c/UK114 family)